MNDNDIETMVEQLVAHDVVQDTLVAKVVRQPPPRDLLDRMVRICLDVLGEQFEEKKQRTCLGIVLRDAIGPQYKRGWVNCVIAHLRRRGLVCLTHDGMYVELLDAPAATTPAVLVIDGPYFEFLAQHLLRGRQHEWEVSVRRLVQRIKAAFLVRLVHKVYVHSTDPLLRTPYHRMLKKAAGFQLEHALDASQRIQEHVTEPCLDPSALLVLLLTPGTPKPAAGLQAARLHSTGPWPAPKACVLASAYMTPILHPFVHQWSPGPIESAMIDCVLARSFQQSGGRTARRWCNFGRQCKYVANVPEHASHFERFIHICPHNELCHHLATYLDGHCTPEVRAHVESWKHACPQGILCICYRAGNYARHFQSHCRLFCHRDEAFMTAPKK